MNMEVKTTKEKVLDALFPQIYSQYLDLLFYPITTAGFDGLNLEIQKINKDSF
jgi:hypothetical protein